MVPTCLRCGQIDMPRLCIVCLSVFAPGEECRCQPCAGQRGWGGSKAKFKWKYACVWHMQGGKKLPNITRAHRKGPQNEIVYGLQKEILCGRQHEKSFPKFPADCFRAF